MYRSLSFYDLLQLPDFKLASKLDDKEAMERIIWSLGVDVAKPYELQDVLHRPLTNNEAWQGLRVHGFSRLDREWIKSGHATLEEIMASCTDDSLLDELNSLDPSKRNHRHVADEDIDWDLDEDGGETEDWVEDDVVGDEGDCV
jgi:hypothetical protein